MNSYNFNLSGNVAVDITESAKQEKPIKIIANDKEHFIEITSMSRQVGSFAPVVDLGNTLIRVPSGYEITVTCFEVESPSILKNPRWVTFDAHTDTYDMLSNELTHDKDYKVLGITDKTYMITTDAGVERFIGKEFFYPATKEDLLPSKKVPVIEDDSFEGLVYEQPEQDSYIDINTMSNEQIEYLNSNVMWCDGDRIGYDYHIAKFITDDDNTWIATEVCNMRPYKQIFFNDIFIKEE